MTPAPFDEAGDHDGARPPSTRRSVASSRALTSGSQRAQHQGAHDDLGGVEEDAALHDQVAESGVGAHELRADDDEEGEAEPDAQRDDDAGQRGGQHHAAQERRARRAEARRGAQQHHVDAEQARRDADEHREEGRVGDERHLRRLPEPEPHEEHRQEGQRRDRPEELHDRLEHQPQRRAQADQDAERERGRGGEAEALGDAQRATRRRCAKRLAVAHHRDAGRRDVGGRRQQRRD